MRNRLCLCLVVSFAISLIIVTQSYAFEITIDVSPKVLNLNSNSEVVTVHTDIKYSDVDASSISLNGIFIESYKSDDRGYFVAKFDSEQIKKLALIVNDYNTLRLEGTTKDNVSFWGEEDILVINKGK